VFSRSLLRCCYVLLVVPIQKLRLGLGHMWVVARVLLCGVRWDVRMLGKVARVLLCIF